MADVDNELLEFLDISTVEDIDEYDYQNANKYFNNAAKTLSSLPKNINGVSINEIQDLVDEAESEFDWFAGYHLDLVVYAEVCDNHISDLYSVIRQLSHELKSRMSDEELEEFNHSILLKRLTQR